MNLLDDILEIIINYTYDELYLVSRKFKNIIDKLLPQFRKLIPLNTDKYSVRAISFSKNFHFKYYLLSRSKAYPDNIIHSPFITETYASCLDKNGNIVMLNSDDSQSQSQTSTIKNVIYIWEDFSYRIVLDNVGQIYLLGNKSIIGEYGHNGSYVKFGTCIVDVSIDKNCLTLHKVNGDKIVYKNNS